MQVGGQGQAGHGSQQGSQQGFAHGSQQGFAHGSQQGLAGQAGHGSQQGFAQGSQQGSTGQAGQHGTIFGQSQGQSQGQAAKLGNPPIAKTKNAPKAINCFFIIKFSFSAFKQGRYWIIFLTQ